MATVKLYQSNVYDYENIPTTADLIATTTNLIQTAEIADLNDSAKMTREIRVKMDDISASANVKFISINDSVWYDVIGWNPLNASVVSFTLEMNPFLTWGIFNALNGTGVSIKGIATRITPQYSWSNNELPENWTPSKQFRRVNIQETFTGTGGHNNGFPLIETGTAGGDAYDLIALTINPEDAEAVSEVLTNYDSSGVLLNYEIKPRKIEVATPTTFKVYNPITKQYVDFWYSGVGVYFASVRTGTSAIGYTITPNSKLDYINSLGLNDAVIAKWSVPNCYAEAPDFSSSASSGKITTLQSDSNLEDETLDVTIADIVSNPNSIYNLKALTYYTSITAEGQSSGDKKTWKFTDISLTGQTMSNIVPSTSTGATFYIMADPSFNGKPYLISKYQDGQLATGIRGEYVVSGSNWLRPITAIGGAAGRDITNYNSEVSLRNERRAGATGVISGALKGASGIITGDVSSFVSGVSSEATSALNTISKQNEINSQRNLQNSVYTPTTYGSSDLNSIQQVVGNNFLITLNTLGSSDIVSFDRYLTAYGYADNVAIGTSEHIYSAVQNRGAHFCYIQMPDPNVVVLNNHYTDAKNYIVRRLQNGIRIWKDGDLNAYTNNCKDTPNWHS